MDHVKSYILIIRFSLVLLCLGCTHTLPRQAASNSSFENCDLKYEVFAFNDSKRLLSSLEKDGILSNLKAAVSEWGTYICGYAPIGITINVLNETEHGRFSAGPTYSVERNINDKGQKVYETAALNKLRTGQIILPEKSDITIYIQPDFMRQSLWIDPQPMKQIDPVPEGKTSMITVLAHELGHGFGITIDLNDSFGISSDEKNISAYSDLISWVDAQAPAFVGENARAIYGGPVPITYFPPISKTQSEIPHITVKRNKHSYWIWQNPEQNLYHYGRFNSASSDKDETFFGLMAGAWQFKKMGRISVGPIDQAILKDLGVPIQ